MSQKSDYSIETSIEIQKTLASINDVTLKIKKELIAINDLVRENGRLNTAVHNANDVLSSIIQDMGIATAEGAERAVNIAETDNELENFMIPITPDFITQKLMSILHGTSDSQ